MKDTDTQPSNHRYQITSAGPDALLSAMEIVFGAGGARATHFAVREGWLYLGWHESLVGSQALPFKIKDAKAAARFIEDWLDDQWDGASAPSEPDIDGSCESNGFEVESVSEDWSYAICRVRPAWAEYHK